MVANAEMTTKYGFSRKFRNSRQSEMNENECKKVWRRMPLPENEMKWKLTEWNPITYFLFVSASKLSNSKRAKRNYRSNSLAFECNQIKAHVEFAQRKEQINCWRNARIKCWIAWDWAGQSASQSASQPAMNLRLATHRKCIAAKYLATHNGLEVNGRNAISFQQIMTFRFNRTIKFNYCWCIRLDANRWLEKWWILRKMFSDAMRVYGDSCLE